MKCKWQVHYLAILLFQDIFRQRTAQRCSVSGQACTAQACSKLNPDVHLRWVVLVQHYVLYLQWLPPLNLSVISISPQVGLMTLNSIKTFLCKNSSLMFFLYSNPGGDKYKDKRLNTLTSLLKYFNTYRLSDVSEYKIMLQSKINLFHAFKLIVWKSTFKLLICLV